MLTNQPTNRIGCHLDFPRINLYRKIASRGGRTDSQRFFGMVVYALRQSSLWHWTIGRYRKWVDKTQIPRNRGNYSRPFIYEKLGWNLGFHPVVLIFPCFPFQLLAIVSKRSQGPHPQQPSEARAQVAHLYQGPVHHLQGPVHHGSDERGVGD